MVSLEFPRTYTFLYINLQIIRCNAIFEVHSRIPSCPDCRRSSKFGLLSEIGKNANKPAVPVPSVLSTYRQVTTTVAFYPCSCTLGPLLLTASSDLHISSLVPRLSYRFHLPSSIQTPAGTMVEDSPPATFKPGLIIHGGAGNIQRSTLPLPPSTPNTTPPSCPTSVPRKTSYMMALPH